MTFLQWLKFQLKRDDRIGDFARDSYRKKSSSEPRFPHDGLKSSMLRFLEYYGSDSAVIESMSDAFAEWGGGIDDVKNEDGGDDE